MEIKINCPYHHDEEVLNFPDSYGENFKADVGCGSKDEKITLAIKLEAGKIAELKMHKDQKPRDPSSDIGKNVMAELQKIRQEGRSNKV